jgi:hypothetical protein
MDLDPAFLTEMSFEKFEIEEFSVEVTAIKNSP